MEEQSTAPTRLRSTWHLFLLSVCFLGVQFCWAVQNASATTFLLELGFSKSVASAMFLAGPISGILIQPLIGALSDRMSDRRARRFGRRTPFMVISSIVCAIAVALFGSSRPLGIIFGNVTDSEQAGLETARAVAVIAFIMTDLSINGVMIMARTLLVDEVPAEQQAKANAMLAACLAAGNVLGYGTGSLQWPAQLFESDVQATYGCASFVLLVCVFATLSVPMSHEENALSPEETERLIQNDNASEDSDLTNPRKRMPILASINQAVRTFPAGMWSVWAVQSLVWFSFFSIFIMGSVYAAIEVYNGDPYSPRDSDAHRLYDEGVRRSNLGLFLSAIVASIWSLALPSLIQKTSHKIQWIGSQVIFGIALILTSVIKTHSGILWLFALQGFAWASVVVIPWTLMSVQVLNDERANRASLLAVMNLSACVPEIAASLSSTILYGVSDANPSTFLVVGGIFALISAVAVLFTRVDDIKPSVHIH
jgi:solute carrier family 45, member 1/2/4